MLILAAAAMAARAARARRRGIGITHGSWLPAMGFGLVMGTIGLPASTLLPIGPLDGAHVGKAGNAAAAGIAGGALLVSLGLI